MALTLGQGAQLLESPSFISRIRGAMVRAAIAVSTEVQGAMTSNAWAKRRQLAIRILNNPDAVVGSFAAAVAADAAFSLTWYPPLLITSSTGVNPSVVTTPVHGYTNGDVVYISGHVANTNANGTWTITVLSTTTFSIPTPGNAVGTATGTVSKQETDVTLAFTVNTLFSAVAGLLPGE
jgi:hypothetical protein